MRISFFRISYSRIINVPRNSRYGISAGVYWLSALMNRVHFEEKIVGGKSEKARRGRENDDKTIKKDPEDGAE